jgi:cathepsin D
MYFSPALVLASAALPFGPLVASAAPLEGCGDGIRIPISKSGGFHDDNGFVDLEKFQISTWSALAKIQSSFEAYEKNTGTPHDSASHLNGTLIKRVAGVPLSPLAYQPGTWAGNISIGTPGQTVTMQFDTAGADLIVPSTGCASTPACKGLNLYDPSTSTTSSDVGSDFEASFGAGSGASSATGELYSDIVTIAGFQVKQVFGAATGYFGGFLASNPGLLGLAYSSISQLGNYNNVFGTLIAQNQVPAPIFSFYLASGGPEIYIGSTNPSLFVPPITYIPVTKQGLWQCVLDAISVNGQVVSIIKPRSGAILASSTNQVVGHVKTVKAIYDLIPGSIALSGGTWSIPCSFNMVVSITFGGIAYQIPPSSFNLGPTSPGSSSCIGTFAGDDRTSLWIVGTSFMENVYTVFDQGNNQIGFANLAT